MNFTQEYDLKVKERILNNTEIDSNGCWNFRSSISKIGYGTIGYKRKTILAHRASWIVFNGEIPFGLNVLHKCDNRRCVNPKHLFLGTQRDNIEDMLKKKREGGRKIDIIKAEQIRNLIKKGIPQKDIAREFKISRALVCLINKQKCWRN